MTAQISSVITSTSVLSDVAAAAPRIRPAMTRRMTPIGPPVRTTIEIIQSADHRLSFRYSRLFRKNVGNRLRRTVATAAMRAS